MAHMFAPGYLPPSPRHPIALRAYDQLAYQHAQLTTPRRESIEAELEEQTERRASFLREMHDAEAQRQQELEQWGIHRESINNKQIASLREAPEGVNPQEQEQPPNTVLPQDQPQAHTTTLPPGSALPPPGSLYLHQAPPCSPYSYQLAPGSPHREQELKQLEYRALQNEREKEVEVTEKDQHRALRDLRMQHQIALVDQANTQRQQIDQAAKDAHDEILLERRQREPEIQQIRARAEQYAEANEQQFWDSGKHTWRKLAEKRPLNHQEMQQEMARQALSHGHPYTYGHTLKPTGDESSIRFPPQIQYKDKLSEKLPKIGTTYLQTPVQKTARGTPRADQDPVWAAVIRHEKESAASIEALGFVWKRVAFASGESVGYWEKEADVAAMARPTLVLLHGLAMDSTSMLSNMSSSPAEKLCAPSGARVLVPDAFGHGDRVAWCANSSAGAWGANHNAQARDLMEFLSLTGVPDNERIDLMGYGMGSCAIVALATQVWKMNGQTREQAQRFNRVVLLNPALAYSEQAKRMISAGDFPDEFAEDSSADHGWIGQGSRSFVDFKTKNETRHFLQLDGYCTSQSRTIAPIMLMQRYHSNAPARYWTGVAAKTVCDMQSAELGGLTALANADVPVLVVFGSVNRVVDPQVRDAIYSKLNTEELCYEHILEGYGHFGCPADNSKWFLDGAYEVASEFLGYSWKEQ